MIGFYGVRQLKQFALGSLGRNYSGLSFAAIFVFWFADRLR
jgi:aspartokinase